MKFISLFAGIGGFDLGIERAGMECVAQVEIDEFCQKVLTKHWPNVPKFGDIRDVGKHNLPPADLICGGFPCQPFSVAGKQGGTADDRHLWPEMLRVITELKPAWVVGENVPGIINIFLDQALSDLENQGYTCETFILPACAFDAQHIRQRVFVVAHANARGRTPEQYAGSGTEANSRGQGNIEQTGSDVPHPRSERLQERDRIQPRRQETDPAAPAFVRWATEPRVGRVANGVPNRVDRLKSLGNAVVPQVAEFIGRAIMDTEPTP